jgi:RNA polymerase sigma factor (sigma-70 family)
MANALGMVETEATEGARAIDSSVKQVLVDNHREFLRFLERRLGRRDVAEDILQEAFARGLDKLEALRDDEAVIPWFYRTLRNATVDYFRKAKVADRALAQFAEEVEASEDPIETVHAEACRCITRLAETLKPEYADALRRVEVEGVSVKAFADERGISKSNAAVRVFRAREALRRQLAVSCGTCADHGCLNCTCGTTSGDAGGGSGCGSH